MRYSHLEIPDGDVTLDLDGNELTVDTSDPSFVVGTQDDASLTITGDGGVLKTQKASFAKVASKNVTVSATNLTWNNKGNMIIGVEEGTTTQFDLTSNPGQKSSITLSKLGVLEVGVVVAASSLASSSSWRRWATSSQSPISYRPTRGPGLDDTNWRQSI